ncbi:MAG: PAS domain S-box protein [Blastocatellia bacterium]
MQNKTAHVTGPGISEVSQRDVRSQLEIILRASQRFNSILDVPAVMRTLVASATELVGARAGMCGTHERGAVVFTEYNENGTVRPINVSFKRGEGVTGHVVETREPYVSNDAAQDARVSAELQRAFGFHSLAAIPIFNPKGELVACLEVHDKAAGRPFDEQDVAALEGLAANAGVALANARMLVDHERTAKALGETEREFRAVFDNALDAILVADDQGRYVDANRAACRLFGAPREELLDSKLADFVEPGQEPEILEAWRVFLGQGEQKGVFRLRRRDGAVRELEYTAKANFIPGRHLSVLRDITERRQSENALKESEARFRQLAENIRKVFWMSDPEGDRMFYVSPAYEKIWGRSCDSLYADARSFLEAVLPGDRARVLSNVEAHRRGEVTDQEYRIVRPDGEVRWVRDRGFPIRDESGRVYRVAGIAEDITDRKAIEAKLREQTEVVEAVNRIGQLLSAELDIRKLLQALTDAATELTGARFGSFFYNVINQEGESYMLYTLSGVPIEHFADFPMPRATDIFAPTFRGEGILRLDDVRQDPRYGKNSPYYGIPPGHLPVVSYLAVPVISRSGEVLGGLFFGHPEPGVFTEREERMVSGLAAQAAIAIDNARLYQEAQAAIRQREEALRIRDELLAREQAARAEAEDANRTKDEFLATVSHELRTPLNAMLGWVRMLRTGKLDEEMSMRAIDIIERNARSQAKLIEDILDVSRIVTGKLRLNTRRVELAPVVDASVDSVRPASDAKAIQIIKSFGGESLAIMGDPDRLQQVVWNLLSNAVKFTPNGGRVEVTLARLDDYAQIKVSDTGHGIGADFLDFVFDRFRQGDSTSTRAYGGLGLGLAIVRHLVEMHGGVVRAESEGPGKGSTFTVMLPVAHPQDAEARPEEGRRDPSG